MAIGYYEFTVRSDDDGVLLKSFLRRKCGLSARSMTVIKYNGGSILRENEALRARDILRDGDLIKVRLPKEQCDIAPAEGDLDILFEDNYLLIVNKPPAMPVHPTKRHQYDTLANIVSLYQQSRGESYTFRALNRLDMDTSGCVILAKDRIAYRLVFPTIRKTYYAVCEGVITEGGTIDAPIGSADASRIKRCVRNDGSVAITHYEPVFDDGKHTLCRVWLETGRTHQIRCHMSYLGHPLAGDAMYGGSMELIQRQALHCQSVTLRHPVTDDMIHVKTPLPHDFKSVINSASPYYPE